MEGPLALTTAAVRSSVLTYGGFDESTDVTTKIKDMAPSIVKGTSKAIPTLILVAGLECRTSNV